jgi:pilus assembly protein FimV
MGKKMVRNLRSGAAIALLLGATVVAQAAGLGKLTVNSALGQILNAEIDLVSLQPGELDSLSARVASPEAFRDARVEYSSSLRLLRFVVDKRANGQPYLKVTSVAPVNEPFVDVLIEVTWPAGRIQREYPILLDPPGYAQGRVALPAATAAPPLADTPPAAAPAVSPSTPASAETTGTGTPSASAEMPSSGATAPAASVTTAGSDTYGPVQRGETLRKIAEQVKPSTVSMEQMLVSLYRENKAAFAGNNMNRLKTGQILKVPSAEDVAQIESRDANQEIRTQVADWKSYRDTLAGGVASLPSRPDTSNAASGRVASAAVTPPPPPSTPGTDVLKLSRTDSGKGASGKGGAGSQDRVNALQEEVTAKDKALKESQSRVADLEKQIRDMQRVIDLSKSLAAAKAPDTKVAVTPVPVPIPPPAKVEPPKVADVKPVEAPKPAPETAPVAEAPKAEPPKVAEAPKPDVPKADVDTGKAAPKKKAPPPPPAKEWYEDIDPIYVALGTGVVIGVPLIFLFIRRRKQRAEAGPTSSMTSAFPSDLKPNTNTGKAGGGLVDTGNSSFLTDFDKTGPGTIDTDEVDPVAEAEVYIAYGRDAQAEEILKEAMARDKNRHEIALKLLEIYHARKSATAFETVAKELRAAVGDSHPLWQKAAAMGAQIDPTNSLYAAAAGGTATFTAMSPAPAPATAKPDLDFDLDGGANVSATEAHASAPAPDFDLDLDADKRTPSESDLPVESSSSIDFDLAPSAPAAPAADARAAEPPKEEKSSFDFDLSGLDFPSSKPAEAAPPPAAPSSGSHDLADLSLDAPSESSGEAVGTKLELAKAYLEIGDKDGAREILNEVAKEGSSAQREEASKLIASL